MLVLWFLSGTGTSYIARSTCLSSGNEKKDCGNFGWKDCSKALLKLKSSKIVMKLKIIWERQWMDWTKVHLKTNSEISAVMALWLESNRGMIMVAKPGEGRGGLRKAGT